MCQLRSEIKKEDFLSRVRAQEKNSYQIAFVEDNNQITAVAGFRFTETLAWGKFLYVDDLVTDEKQRSKGYGDKLIDWLLEYAKEKQCEAFHLDSCVKRFLAHRFYFRKKLVISCYHFELELKDK